MVKFIKFIILLVSIAFAFNTAKSTNVYDYNYAIGIGLSTSKILGNGPATRPISLFPTGDQLNIGGSYNGAMPGIDLRLTYQLDDEGDWRLPLGLEYTFYSARERLPLATNFTLRFTNEVNVFKPYIGINYTIVRFPLANALVYGGIDLRANVFHLAEYNQISENEDVLDNVKLSKSDAVRFGGIFKLGIEGELHENYMLNASWGLHTLNLLGREHDRGQLFTPVNNKMFRENLVTGEDFEDIVYNFYFSLMIQYRF